CLNTEHPFLGYIARPLNGIWATAPYLHNGSVPSLYDLLLPQEQRPATFYTGSHEFDPSRVGYLTAPGPDNAFLFDTHLEGNSNAGHDFAREYDESQRLALLEYLKTL
ncbi:di-heme-cytochrome C peroxidase, partial [Pseudomonas aeruginosa]|nr:di-heme-cytochrome C peroxidase [Pseudomonas aeruginosa]